MENPPDPRPVYEADQVVTLYDLMAIRGGYIEQYRRTRMWEFRRRFMLRAAVGVCNELLHWLHHGKPLNGVDCQGGSHGS